MAVVSGLYTILSLEQVAPQSFILRVKPIDGEIFPYLAGQFVRIDQLEKTVKPHFFSIASSSTQKKYLEFGFKVYGQWTTQLSQKSVGDTLTITGPFGKFTWDNSVPYAVFLAGGMGIVPFISMLRTLVVNTNHPAITLIYGNRTEERILYRKELEQLISRLPEGKIIHVLSDLPTETAWKGYQGFITSDILEKEIDFSKNPSFFLCGPPVFTKLMQTLLEQHAVVPQSIRQELFT